MITEMHDTVPGPVNGRDSDIMDGYFDDCLEVLILELVHGQMKQSDSLVLLLSFGMEFVHHSHWIGHSLLFCVLRDPSQ